MDIISPATIWIDDFCYRLPTLHEYSPENGDPGSHQTPYHEDPEELQLNWVSDEPMAVEYDMEVTDTGRYRLRMPVSKVFWPKLVGYRGGAKKRVEEETRTTILIPRQHESGDIVIVGDNRRDVQLACEHIQSSIRAVRSYMSYTHFVSIPFQSDEIVSNFMKFRTQAMELSKEITEDIFTSPEKLHSTAVMLCLTDDRESKHACEILSQLEDSIRGKLGSRPLRVPVEGIEIMNDDPTRTNVVFAKINHPLLQEISDTIAAEFRGTEYVKQRDIKEKVKLHMTLLNTRHLKSKDDSVKDEGSKRRNWKPPVYIDASPILKELGHFKFGIMTVDSIHLSKLGTVSDGYYPSAYTIKLST